MKGKLILENGMTFEGSALGHISESVGEAVFTTSSLGYTDLMSDPSLLGKIIIMTSPLVGSRGVLLEDMESKKVWAAGLIAREVPELSGSDRYDLFLDGLLREHRVMGIDGIDTRYLTQTIRKGSPMKAIITTRDLSQEEVDAIFQRTLSHNSWESVSCREKHLITSSVGGKKIGILDLGVKKSFLELFSSLGYNLVILPWDTSSEEILSLDLDALILSDGP